MIGVAASHHASDPGKMPNDLGAIHYGFQSRLRLVLLNDAPIRNATGTQQIRHDRCLRRRIIAFPSRNQKENGAITCIVHGRGDPAPQCAARRTIRANRGTEYDDDFLLIRHLSGNGGIAHPIAWSTLPPRFTGSAAISANAITQGSDPRLTQLWTVPR